jgi:hypothetical protein
MEAGQELKYKGKRYKVTKIEGDFITMKCMVCGSKIVRIHKDQL